MKELSQEGGQVFDKAARDGKRVGKKHPPCVEDGKLGDDSAGVEDQALSRE